MEPVDLAISEIREVYGYLRADPTEYHGSIPGFASHAADYSSNAERLRRYANIAVKGRILFFISLAYIKTSLFLEMYLEGIARANPFSLLFSTRAQIELVAVALDVITSVKENAGNHIENFAARVQKADEALITATYGTRDERSAEIIEKFGLSRLRPKRDRDADVLKAVNIVTRVERLAKTTAYRRLAADYRYLCDLLHPNFGQNVILMRESTAHKGAIRSMRDHPGIMQTVLGATAQPMALAADGTVRELNTIEEPFPQLRTK